MSGLDDAIHSRSAARRMPSSVTGGVASGSGLGSFLMIPYSSSHACSGAVRISGASTASDGRRENKAAIDGRRDGRRSWAWALA